MNNNALSSSLLGQLLIATVSVNACPWYSGNTNSNTVTSVSVTDLPLDRFLLHKLIIQSPALHWADPVR